MEQDNLVKKEALQAMGLADPMQLTSLLNKSDPEMLERILRGHLTRKYASPEVQQAAEELISDNLNLSLLLLRVFS